MWYLGFRVLFFQGEEEVGWVGQNQRQNDELSRPQKTWRTLTQTEAGGEKSGGLPMLLGGGRPMFGARF